MKTINKDKKLMEVLKVSELRHHIATTEKGELCMCLRYMEDKYFFTLDSVPCEKDINDDLLEIAFPPEVVVPQPIGAVNAPLAFTSVHEGKNIETVSVLSQSPVVDIEKAVAGSEKQVLTISKVTSTKE